MRGQTCLGGSLQGWGYKQLVSFPEQEDFGALEVEEEDTPPKKAPKIPNQQSKPFDRVALMDPLRRTASLPTKDTPTSAPIYYVIMC